MEGPSYPKRIWNTHTHTIPFKATAYDKLYKSFMISLHFPGPDQSRSSLESWKDVVQLVRCRVTVKSENPSTANLQHKPMLEVSVQHTSTYRWSRNPFFFHKIWKTLKKSHLLDPCCPPELLFFFLFLQLQGMTLWLALRWTHPSFEGYSNGLGILKSMTIRWSRFFKIDDSNHFQTSYTQVRFIFPFPSSSGSWVHTKLNLKSPLALPPCRFLADPHRVPWQVKQEPCMYTLRTP